MEAGALLRDARRRHGLDQRTLARRARTSQTQISRIERGEISPTVGMLNRLLEAMGERLELTAVNGPRPNVSSDELRRSYDRLRADAIVKDGMAYVGVDDLVAMKQAAGRDVDHIDIRAFEEARGAGG